MPLQCSTQWDGLGHIFDHGQAWNGRNAADVVTSEGDQRHGHRKGRRPDRWTGGPAGRGPGAGSATASCPTGSRSLPITWRRSSPRRARRPASAAATSSWSGPASWPGLAGSGWGGYAGGPAPGLSFTCAPWLHGAEIAAIATDTWGFEVRPNEFDHAFQPLHQVVIPHIGLYIGEMWDTGGPGHGLRGRRPVRRSGSLPRRFPSPARSEHQSTRSPSSNVTEEIVMPSVRNVLIVGGGAAGCAAAILFARDGAAVDLIEIKPDLSALGLRYHRARQRLAGAAPARRLERGVRRRLRLQHARAARPRRDLAGGDGRRQDRRP